MDDVAVVAALRNGDPAAFAHLYDMYAARLHAYAVTLLGEREAASDAVHDTFLLAHDRIHQLRDPALLRPWLYAITRSQAQRVLRTRGRTSDLTAAADVTADEVRWNRALDADEARLLVLAALAGLNDGDREVIELALRHDLDTGSIARTLGRSSSHTSALVSRAKQQFDLALTAVLLMRTRGRDCLQLHLIIGEAAHLTPLLRKRIARHARDCDSCSGYRRSAIAVLPGVATAMPFGGVPDALRDRLLSASGDLRHDASPRVIEGREIAWDRDGFPRAETPAHRRWVAGAVVACVLTVALVVALGTSLTPSSFPVANGAAPVVVAPAAPSIPAPSGKPRPVALASAPTATPIERPSARNSSEPSAARVSEVVEQSQNASAPRPRSVSPRPTASPRPGTPSAPSAPRAAPRAGPTVAVTWNDLDPSSCGPTYDIEVRASIVGASLDRVTATWHSTSGSGTRTAALARASDGEWLGTLTGVPDTGARLTVTITTTHGLAFTSEPDRVTNTCAG